jgi:hypothetical protein
MRLDNTEDFHDYRFIITVPSEDNPDLSDGTCTFDIRTVGWLEELPYETAFWDEEYLSNTVSTTKWLINMGFETAETLADDSDGNNPLGFCPVVTADKSQNGGKSALQILNWSEISLAKKYRITGYKQNEDKTWAQIGTPYNPAEQHDGITEKDGILSYKTWASNEGIYAYFIEALDAAEKVIGKTLPKDDEFKCTYKVQWSTPIEEEKKEEEEEELELPVPIIINVGELPEPEIVQEGGTGLKKLPVLGETKTKGESNE